MDRQTWQDGFQSGKEQTAIKIFKELEEPCPHEKGTLKADCRFCYQAIKSRHGVKE